MLTLTAQVDFVAAQLPSFRFLIDEELFERMVKRLAKDHHLPISTAARALDASIGFVKLCAEHRGLSFTPSKLVDLGWHTMLLYTREYFQLCHSFGVPYIHHTPTDKPGVKHEGSGPALTMEFMSTNGILFDAEIWMAKGYFQESASCCAKCDADNCNNGWCNGT